MTPACHFFFNAETRARLPGDGPRESFQDYVEWVPVHNGSPITTVESEEETNIPATDCRPVKAPAPVYRPEHTPVPVVSPERTPASIISPVRTLA